MNCVDCDVNLLLMNEVYRKMWSNTNICQQCFTIRLARLSELVPVDCGRWVTKAVAEQMLKDNNGMYKSEAIWS